MKKLNLILILMMTFLITSCTMARQYEYDDTRLNVVVTTTMLSDVTKELGKDLLNVYTLMSPGVDPHSYIARPSDNFALKKADLVIYNGLHLEDKMTNTIDTLGEAKVLNASKNINEIDLLKDENDAVDPHIWFDFVIWEEVIKNVSAKLIALDKKNENLYLEYLNNYLNKFSNYQVIINEKINELPIDKRVLITAHDAFGYFGRQHNFKVYSIQGISTQSEASPFDIQQIANFIVLKKVKAVFLESSIPPQTIRSVINAVGAQGFSTTIGGELYSDSLSNQTDEGSNYLDMYLHNVNTIVNALK